jgi:hypothetical protein
MVESGPLHSCAGLNGKANACISFDGEAKMSVTISDLERYISNIARSKSLLIVAFNDNQRIPLANFRAALADIDAQLSHAIRLKKTGFFRASHRYVVDIVNQIDVIYSILSD